jgi:hypothetical protein
MKSGGKSQTSSVTRKFLYTHTAYARSLHLRIDRWSYKHKVFWNVFESIPHMGNRRTFRCKLINARCISPILTSIKGFHKILPTFPTEATQTYVLSQLKWNGTIPGGSLLHSQQIESGQRRDNVGSLKSYCFPNNGLETICRVTKQLLSAHCRRGTINNWEEDKKQATQRFLMLTEPWIK